MWYQCNTVVKISIHALLAESDQDLIAKELALAKISIHALLAESDGKRGTAKSQGSHFYPRSPCGERRDNVKCCCSSRDFYPRSPCGERHCHKIFLGWIFNFYPRSPCGERQTIPRGGHINKTNFYPRSPCGERLGLDGRFKL